MLLNVRDTKGSRSSNRTRIPETSPKRQTLDQDTARRKTMKDQYNPRLLAVACAAIVLGLLFATSVSVAQAQQQNGAPLHSITTISSTIPSNGDINPYGIFRIPRTVGNLRRGSILVSNFN